MAFTSIFTILVLRPRFDFDDLDRPALPGGGAQRDRGVAIWTWVARRSAAPALIWLGTLCILVFVLFALVRYSRQLEARQRMEQMAFLGKYSSQLAHGEDPIAVERQHQCLQRQLRSGKSIEQQAELLERLAALVARLNALVDSIDGWGAPSLGGRSGSTPW
jgi:hypothetical protein